MHITRYIFIFNLLLASFFCNTSEEKPIVVVIPSYNNKAWYKNSIQSVALQDYSNYRVIYINDCSTDGTGDLVREYIEELGVSDRFTVIDNSVRSGALANIYRAVHTCDDDEIVAILDADDWLATNDALTRVNEAYQDENIWMTYGQFRTHPRNEIGFCETIPISVIQQNFFREYDWVTSHLRTYYAKLFKHIYLKDLLYKGMFFDVTGDMAVTYPLLEMAAGHFVCIPDVLYVYNEANPENDARKKLVQQISCKYYIQSREKYVPIQKLDAPTNSKIALIVFSDGNMQTLFNFLDSVKTYLQQYYEIKIISKKYNSADPKSFSQHIAWYGGSDCALRDVLLQELENIDSSYVLLACDHNRLCRSCDIADCVNALKGTYAHAFYLGLGKETQSELPPLIPLYQRDTVYAWQYKYAEFAFKQPYSIDMTLYKKETIYSALKKISFRSLEQMIIKLNSMQFDYEHVGLCFDVAKAALE